MCGYHIRGHIKATGTWKVAWTSLTDVTLSAKAAGYLELGTRLMSSTVSRFVVSVYGDSERSWDTTSIQGLSRRNGIPTRLIFFSEKTAPTELLLVLYFRWYVFGGFMTLFSGDFAREVACFQAPLAAGYDPGHAKGPSSLGGIYYLVIEGPCHPERILRRNGSFNAFQ
ncbi:hypothetical protein N7528_001478 [Penicillium herquei]|nr:hypothetical protein N7528_001478 [Penicillium herquei]